MGLTHHPNHAGDPEPLATLFDALSEDIRLKIVRLLVDRELCVCDLMAALEMGQSRVSFHLGVLKSAGVIASRKAGRWNAYRLRSGEQRLDEILALVHRDKTLSIDGEEKRLRFYLKQKKRIAPDGSPCCPDDLPVETRNEDSAQYTAS